MEGKASLLTKIPSWGVDLDPARRPAYPKEKTPPWTGAHWDRPDQQLTDKKINMSTEYNHMPAVFGTTLPPRGISGLLRNFAYKYSEGKLQHWMILLFADRVNMVEGLVDDLAHGHIPNVVKEMGLKSEWKYNRKSFVTRLAVSAVLIGGTIGIWQLMKAPVAGHPDEDFDRV